ncbi:RNase3 domain-containing protein [Xylariaceae sp. FL0016]|nr:RNase3 domain-containing protein [Xylariaceae sp. FL0016]
MSAESPAHGEVEGKVSMGTAVHHAEPSGDAHDQRTAHPPKNALQVEHPAVAEDSDTLSSDEGSEPSLLPPMQASTLKKRLDVEGFDEYIRDLRNQHYSSLSNDTSEGEIKSAAWIIREAQKESIISSPREYQTELFELAKKKNIIAVLDTGTGKTLIAALLLRHVIAQELECRKAGKRPRVSFFVVDKNNLVHQQYEVLKHNLDHPVSRFSGDTFSPEYSQEFWSRQCEDNMVIVCTAAILHLCLVHSFIRMDQINLLVFDEAHHAKGNHPYAMIIKDFYSSLDPDQVRPRILGMTASPVDAKTEINAAASRLEGLLNCEIATVDSGMVTKSFSTRPITDTIEYSKSCPPFETVLWQRLHQVVGQNKTFAKLFVHAKEATAELGRWCADRIWKRCLTPEELQKIEAKTERDFDNALRPMSVLDTEIAAVREAFGTVTRHHFPDVNVDAFHLSNKVLSLIEWLRHNFVPSESKCIVFVEKRLTVRLLADLFQQPGLLMPELRTGFLVGSTHRDIGDLGTSLKEQILTVSRFREGKLNCLFATSVAEEGIDIPDCNIIIRFDLSKTVIQFIQSRGRARSSGARFMNMVEIGNTHHVQSIFGNEDDEAKLRQFCNTSPESRTLTGQDFSLDQILSKEKHLRTYVVPSTGAKLTYGVSPVVLASFVASLPHPIDATPRADFIMRTIGREFHCEVILPESSPITNAVGKRAASKLIAKCSAAFEMCLQLRRKRFLDDNLRSTFAKRLPAMRNARLAISAKKRSEYSMRTKPEIWSVRGMPEKLHITVFRLLKEDALEKPSRPIAILTRQPLPKVASFPLFFGDQRTSEVECIPLPISMSPSDTAIDGLNHFTLRAFKDVFSKDYLPEPHKMPYFIAPLLHSHDYDFVHHATTKADSSSLIDWNCITLVRSTPEDVGWDEESYQISVERFVIDPHDGSRKFYTIRPRNDLKPTDLEPPGVPKGQHRKKSHDDAPLDIWNFSISLWSKSRKKIPFRHDLPVVEAEYIPLRRNLLDEFGWKEHAARRCYVVFETLRISPLPVTFVAMVYTLPAIVYRLDNNLIALDACQMLGLNVRSDLALEALTKDSENTEEHSDTQVSFQGGMGKNYERLEFLGDSFLKMSTTIALFVQDSDKNEFMYHVDRMVMICNQNLFNNALEVKLEEYVRTFAFNRRIWYPDGMVLLKGKQKDSILGKKGLGSHNHVLADKSVADVCEALIGASYMTTYEQKSFDMAIQAVTKFVNKDDHKMMTWSDYYAAYKIPAWQSAEPSAAHIDLAHQIGNKLGYHFKYPRLLRSAFNHPSYASVYEGIPSYQRLEFLGDALLDMVCVDFLYQRFPGADPQWLTEHKMAMVSNHFLGCLCTSLGLQKHMLSMTPGLPQEILEYVTLIQNAREQAEEEAVSANLDRTAYARNFWVGVKKPPKCLPDIVEAYVGAVFIDSKCDYSQVQSFFDTQVRPYFEDMHLYDTFANKHPVTFLTNALSLRFGCLNWRIMAQEIDDPEGSVSETQVVCGIMIHNKVRAHEHGSSSRYAKVRIAERMVDMLNGVSVEEFKRNFDCDCSAADAGANVNPFAHATAI